MARFLDDREPEMIAIVERLAKIPELDNRYSRDMVGQTEYQEALETYLLHAVRHGVRLPMDILDDVRAISDELLPKSMRNQDRELISA